MEIHINSPVSLILCENERAKFKSHEEKHEFDASLWMFDGRLCWWFEIAHLCSTQKSILFVFFLNFASLSSSMFLSDIPCGAILRNRFYLIRVVS